MNKKVELVEKVDTVDEMGKVKRVNVDMVPKLEQIGM